MAQAIRRLRLLFIVVVVVRWRPAGAYPWGRGPGGFGAGRWPLLSCCLLLLLAARAAAIAISTCTAALATSTLRGGTDGLRASFCGVVKRSPSIAVVAHIFINAVRLDRPGVGGRGPIATPRSDLSSGPSGGFKVQFPPRDRLSAVTPFDRCCGWYLLHNSGLGLTFCPRRTALLCGLLSSPRAFPRCQFPGLPHRRWLAHLRPVLAAAPTSLKSRRQPARSSNRALPPRRFRCPALPPNCSLT